MRGFECPNCGSNTLHQITTGLSRRSEVVDLVDGQNLLCCGAEIFAKEGATQYNYYRCGACNYPIDYEEGIISKFKNPKITENRDKEYFYASNGKTFYLVNFCNRYFWTNYTLCASPEGVGISGGFETFDDAIDAARVDGKKITVI